MAAKWFNSLDTNSSLLSYYIYCEFKRWNVSLNWGMSTQIELLVPNWLAIVINLSTDMVESKSREKYLSADWFYTYSSIGSKSFSDSNIGNLCPFVISKYFLKLSICTRLDVEKIISWNTKKIKDFKSIQKGIDSIV